MYLSVVVVCVCVCVCARVQFVYPIICLTSLLTTTTLIMFNLLTTTKLLVCNLKILHNLCNGYLFLGIYPQNVQFKNTTHISKHTANSVEAIRCSNYSCCIVFCQLIQCVGLSYNSMQQAYYTCEQLRVDWNKCCCHTMPNRALKQSKAICRVS